MGKKEIQNKYLRRLWILIFAPGIIVGLAILGSFYFSEFPSLEELENPKSNLATEILASNNKVLGKFYIENRTDVQFNQLNPNLVNALVATEDARFYKHSGVDIKALFRSIYGVLKGSSETSGGGSTLSQQLAKMLFPRENLGKFGLIFRKFKEWIIAIRLEKNYTKDEIIAMYLNKFDFINNAVGIKSAASIYFNSSPDSLKLQQAAMLVGMAKNPSLFNPIRHPKRALERRNVVLKQMEKYNFITEKQYDSLKVLPFISIIYIIPI